MYMVNSAAIQKKKKNTQALFRIQNVYPSTFEVNFLKYLCCSSAVVACCFIELIILCVYLTNLYLCRKLLGYQLSEFYSLISPDEDGKLQSDGKLDLFD